MRIWLKRPISKETTICYEGGRVKKIITKELVEITIGNYYIEEIYMWIVREPRYPKVWEYTNVPQTC